MALLGGSGNYWLLLPSAHTFGVNTDWWLAEWDIRIPLGREEGPGLFPSKEKVLAK